MTTREALHGTLGLLKRTQIVLTEYLEGDRSAPETIVELLEMHDCPEQRALETAAKEAIASGP